MKKIVATVLFCLCTASAQNNHYSFKEYEQDHQEVFNAAKKLFSKAKNKEFIVDTSWNFLKAVHTDAAIGLFDIEIVQNVYTLELNTTKQNSPLGLSIYTQKGQKKNYISSDKALHAIFWNRIDYILNKSEWMECRQKGNFLCFIDKKSLK